MNTEISCPPAVVELGRCCEYRSDRSAPQVYLAIENCPHCIDAPLMCTVLYLQGSADAAANSLSALSLRDVPLGFGTGDAKIDAAATVLRMLYIRDLRALQTQIDQAIVAVQVGCCT